MRSLIEMVKEGYQEQLEFNGLYQALVFIQDFARKTSWNNNKLGS
jgi:hypothetical protein